jgi:hypothetical protein
MMTALEHLRPVVPMPFAILAQVHHRRDHALPRHLPQVAQAKGAFAGSTDMPRVLLALLFLFRDGRR